MRLRAVLAVVTAVVLTTVPSPVGARRGGASAYTSEAGDFDFYLLALSWSPEHCRTHPKDADSHECETADGFVVHGLWPEADHGPAPTECRHSGGPSDEVVKGMLDLMPSAGLIRHEWQAHGACSGESPSHYFRDVRTAYERVRIPPRYRALRAAEDTPVDALTRAFVDVDPTLAPDRLSLVCDGDALREVRICLDKRLAPRSCGTGSRDRCPRGRVVVLPRGD